MFRKSIYLLLIMMFLSSTTTVFAQPSRYRTETEILQDFFTLQSSYSTVLTYDVIGQTVEGRDIYLFKLGNPLGVTVFIDASIHGHEYITTEALYYCIEWLLTERTDILESNYVLFIPIINRDSYRIRRTNAAGVDLNRNFLTYWQPTGSGTIYYSGPSPLSEPETQTIHNALGTYHPRWYINLHAGYEETRITPPSIQPIYEDVYARIRETSRNTFGVDPFPYDTYQFYEGMARYEGEAQGAYTWEIEISSTNPPTGQFFDRVVPRVKAVFLETFLEGISEPDPTPNQPPVAEANGPYTGMEDAAITFSAAGSFDLDGDVLSYTWDFGDGSSLTTSSATTVHTYTTGEAGQPAVYSVSLVVNDGTIDSLPAETTVTVTGVNDLPLADANGPYAGVIGEDILFDAGTSRDEEGISSYTWDLGDGTVETGATVTHHYAAAGTYTVQLMVTDTDGAEDTATTTAEITEAPAQPIASTTLTLSREDKTRGRGTRVSRAQATVSVTFEGIPLKGSTVYGQWSVAVDMIVIGTTNGEGHVTFRTNWVQNAGLFTFTITQIEQDGITYTLQGELSESI
jgi:PKD repeat protein